MFFIIRKIVILVLIVGISACSTLKSVKNDDNDATKKIRTAKINAYLGVAYLERKKLQRAKEKLTLALAQGPNLPEPLYSMGYYLEATGHKEEAKKYYMKAVALAPQRGDVQNNYGTYLCRNGQYREAVRHFQLAVNDPSYSAPADAYENAGLCALKIPDNGAAYHYFTLALSHDRSRPVALLNLAELNYQKGDYAAAKNRLNQYRLIAPQSPQSSLLSKRIANKLNANGNQLDEVAATAPTHHSVKAATATLKRKKTTAFMPVKKKKHIARKRSKTRSAKSMKS